jgi:hypothetical protein
VRPGNKEYKAMTKVACHRVVHTIGPETLREAAEFKLGLGFELRLE